MVSIKFLPNMPSDDEDEPDGWYGEIRIGKHREKFLSCLSFWSMERYQAQWREAITRIVRGEPVAALITVMYDPLNANFIFWWPVYREDKAVIFHEQMLFLDQIEGGFDLENPYRHISPRKSHDEEGLPISEWVTTVKALEKFLASLTDIPKRRK